MYPEETLGKYDDDGTMPANVATLAEHVVGHKIVSAVKAKRTDPMAWRGGEEIEMFVITLDNGKEVRLADDYDCCAYTELEEFLLHADRIDHVITGVGTTDGYTTWHVFADYGDVLEMKVGWSCGNPFYYGYGFAIAVKEVPSDVG